LFIRFATIEYEKTQKIARQYIASQSHLRGLPLYSTCILFSTYFMAKDPAFLFYPNDFTSGTRFMTDEQVGKYIRLLCAQFDCGHLTEEQMILICKSYDNHIFSKFIKDSDGKFYNERLEIEKVKRKNFCKSRGKNREGKKKTSNSYDSHMENENEDVNDTTILNNTIQAKNSEFGKQFSQTESLMENAMRTAKAFNLDWQRERILDYLRAYVNEMNAKQEVKPKFKDFSSHFVSWMKIHAKKVQPSQVQPQYKPLDGN